MLPHGKGKIIKICSVMCLEVVLNIHAFAAAMHASPG